MPKGFKKLVILVTICSMAFAIISPVAAYINLPSDQKVTVGQHLDLTLNCPQGLLNQLIINVDDGQGILGLSEGVLANVEASSFLKTSPVPKEPGKVSLSLKLFGLIPVKEIEVDVLPDVQLYPGGQSVGVLLRTDGILIVGQSPIVDQKGKNRTPAQDAGIKVGDVIIAVNGEPLENDESLARIINKLGKAGKKIVLNIERDGKLLDKEIVPIYCEESETYRIGLYVRDNAGGVGTLTFVDPVTHKYGALGHMIADSETQQQIDILEGKLVKARIEGIKKGEKGYPGEKMGTFVSDKSIGSIDKNSYCGIFGTIKEGNVNYNSYHSQPLPIAFSSQVTEGSAKILTVLNGQEIEEFDIMIEKLMPGRKDGKGMVIKITDEQLLKTTGGIIQGMSGSPIIQNGKIIGAVTHVFINDPTKGYGIFIEDMLIETGIINNEYERLGA